jgi:hypothetical protein
MIPKMLSPYKSITGIQQNDNILDTKKNYYYKIIVDVHKALLHSVTHTHICTICMYMYKSIKRQNLYSIFLFSKLHIISLMLQFVTKIIL